MTQNLVEIEKSKTLFINEISAEEIEKGRDIVRFGFGQSPFLPPENVINALKENAYSKEYTPVQGLPQLRRKIADFHSKLLMNTTFQEDQVFIAGGSKILLFNIMLAFEKATLFLVGPSWVSYEPQGRLLKHPVERIQTT